MRWCFVNVLGGLVVTGLLVGCTPPKPTDDGSGPRGMATQQTAKKGAKTDKPMDPSHFPPMPPPPPGKENKNKK